MLFLWAWPQPDFDTADRLIAGENEHAVDIVSQRRWHSARALGGLGFVFIGYGLQLWVVLVHGRPVLSPPQPKSKDGDK